MSNEIIKVLDYLGTQLGIAIDWSAENVMPQVMDILGRYRIYAIIGNILGLMAICVVLWVIYFIAKKCKKDITTETAGLWWSNGYYDHGPSGLAIVFMILGGSTWVAMCIVAVHIVQDILQLAIVPELQYLSLLKGYMP